MSRLVREFLSLLCALALFALAIPHSAFAQAQACITQGQVTSPHTITGNAWGASRLNPGDTVLIEQVEKSGAQLCHALTNNSNNALFVPWKTATEWTAFLNSAPKSQVDVSTSTCCPPIQITLCGASTSVNIGSRVLGVPLDANGSPTLTLLDSSGNVMNPPNLNNWGALNDTYGPTCASVVNGNSKVDYQVDYVCTSQGWKKTREVGSCTPIDGACAVSAGATISTFPSDPQTLCGPGSIFQNLAVQTGAGGATTGWTWQCAGTPGMKTAACSATFSNASPGTCGTDSGKTLASLTSTDSALCSAGTVSGFSGTGPWTWTCSGIAGGTSSNCSAAYTNANYANCGSADGGAYSATQMQNFATSSPTSLCSAGILGTPANPGIEGGGSSSQWYWYCSNASGSDYQYCTASNTTIDGACGTDSGTSFPSLTSGPTGANLCYNSKSVASIVTFNSSNNTWTWTCGGIKGGATSPLCTAFYNANAVAGVCGSDANGSFSNLTSTDPNLCAQGTVASYTVQGSQITWQCVGTNNGATVTCNATNTNVPAYCGNAAGNPSLTAPTKSLCGTGDTASAVTEVGSQWTWTCTNAIQTSTTSCQAQVQTAPTVATCGTATQNTASASKMPSKNLCGSGDTASTPIFNTNSNNWQWTCSLASTGSAVPCSDQATSSSGSGSSGNGGNGGTNGTGIPGQCGTAAGVTSVLAPSANLCSVGTSTTAVSDATNTNWTWDCLSTNGGTTATCTAPMALSNGTCGLSNDTYIPNAPNNCSTCNLCSSGAASAVSGNALTGPWTWTCNGIGGGTNSPSCIAYLCGLCTGNKSSTVNTTVTVSLPSCTVTESVTWTETDSLNPSGSSSYYTMSWSDALGAHSNTIYPSTATYCPVCYGSLASATQPVVTISALSGACASAIVKPYTVGQVLPVLTYSAK